MRHNNLRDTTARLLEEVCKDVKVEPSLLPYVQPAISGNDKDRGRLDVSAIGVWSPCKKSMCDIRVFHPNAPSHMNRPLPALYAQNEAEEKAAYNDRVLNVEKATFTPLVFATTGGMGMESSRFFKKVAEMLAGKRKEQVSCVLAYVRTRLRFALLMVYALKGGVSYRKCFPSQYSQGNS